MYTGLLCLFLLKTSNEYKGKSCVVPPSCSNHPTSYPRHDWTCFMNVCWIGIVMLYSCEGQIRTAAGLPAHGYGLEPGGLVLVHGLSTKGTGVRSEGIRNYGNRL